MSAATILVVEDNPITRKMMRFALAREGFTVLEARDGGTALGLAREHRIDLVLQDFVLPDMDGLQLIAGLRTLPGGSDIPVLLITGIVSQIAELRQRADGRTEVLAKPIEPSRLIELVNAQLDGRSGSEGEGRPALTLAGETVGLLPADVRKEAQRERPEPLIRKAAIQAAALSVIRGLSMALANPGELPRILGDVLVHSLDAAGLSTGLLYLPNQAGVLELQAQAGLPSPMRAAAGFCFGHPELLLSSLESGEPAAYGLGESGLGIGPRALLEGLAKTSALIIPFVVGEERVGVLALAADTQDLSEPTWLAFAAALAVHFGQAIALGRSLARGAASEARYRSLMENANDAILLVLPDLGILEANRRAEELLGCSKDRIVGRSYAAFFPREDRGGLADDHAALLAQRGATRVDDRRLVRADGSVVFVDVSASLIRIGDETVVLSILHDVTEKKRLEGQLAQAQKMEAVGRLAGGVAHDFNNLLGVITGYGELLLKDLGPEHTGSKRVEEIQRAAERAAALTRQLLAFSRQQVLQPMILDLDEVVANMDTMLRRLIGEDIHLVTTRNARLGHVRADPGQIEQVLMNLVVNARDAMPKGGGLIVETADVILDEAYAHAHPEVQPGRFVMLKVSDTGEGMDAATQAHIFEPFFTTKKEGKGTGLGLATVFGIVQQSGGSIALDSELGLGTTCRIYFPRVEEALSRPSLEVPAPSAGGTETILLVEDEDPLREMIREILEGAGFTVLESSDPDEALFKVSSGDSPIRLLLTDVVMPRMSGPELARSVRLARPEIKVLFMSGYTDEAMNLHGVLDGRGHFLQKPFTADALLRKVRAAIDEP